MSTAKAGDPISAKAWTELPDEMIRAVLERIAAMAPLYANNLGDRLSLRVELPKPQTVAADSFVALPQGGSSGSSVIYVPKGTINDMDDGSGLTVIGDSPGVGTPGNMWELHAPPASTRYLYTDATIDPDGTITAVKLQFAGSAPTTGAGNPSTGAPPAHAYRKLFKAVTDNNYVTTITQYTSGAQQARVHVSGFNCTTQTAGVYWLP
jgi:hypothetical protein